jgi:hypothetical protein
MTQGQSNPPRFGIQIDNRSLAGSPRLLPGCFLFSAFISDPEFNCRPFAFDLIYAQLNPAQGSVRDYEETRPSSRRRAPLPSDKNVWVSSIGILFRAIHFRHAS